MAAGVEYGRRIPIGSALAVGAFLSLAALVAAPGCSGRGNDSPYRTEVVYSIPDDFKLAMLRFERRFEAQDVEGVLRSFDPLKVTDFRGLEKSFLAFTRRAAEVEWSWRISDVRETNEVREFEVPWKLTFLDVLHGHKVHRRGVTVFEWSREAVPRLVGLSRDRLFPEVSPVPHGRFAAP